MASDGGIFSYGDASFYGSTGAIALNKPIVGMAATPDGKGYWLVASDGGIFSFGDATFFGSTGSIALNEPIVGMAPTPDGKGYWLVASDGGIFNFGDAAFYGSTGSIQLNQPIVGMAPTPDGKGYWLVASDGGIFNFGDAAFDGSAAGGPALDPAERVVASPSGAGLLGRGPERHGLCLRRCQGAPADGGPDVRARHGRGPGRPLRLRSARQALHLGRQRTSWLRLLRAGAGLVGERRTASASHASRTTSTRRRASRSR